MPRPMKPMQFTVLTRASASSSRMLPVLYSIISIPPDSEVPFGTNLHNRGMICAHERSSGPWPHGGRLHTDAVDKIEWEGAVHQELGLLSLLHIGLPEVPCRDRCPVELVQLLHASPEFRVACAGV